MIPIHTVFIMVVVIFALIGSLRGWAKELIVSFSVVLAFFIEQILTEMVPPLQVLWDGMPPMSKFWVRIAMFSIIVLFGYASPSVAQRLGSRVARERLQDVLLGFFIGLLNGLLIVGALWFYVDEAYYGVQPDQYTIQQVVTESGDTEERVVYTGGAEGIGGINPPAEDSVAWKIIPYLPPRLISGPPLYLAVGLSFVFVIIVFI